MKRIILGICLLVAIAAAGYFYLRRPQEEPLPPRSLTPYLESPEGRIRKAPRITFTHMELQKKKISDGTAMYYGKVTWTKDAGAEGTPAQLPVELYLPVEERKELRLVGTYFTGEDGKFWFVVPDTADYLIGVRPERAKNMPEKARKFFERIKGRRKIRIGKKVEDLPSTFLHCLATCCSTPRELQGDTREVLERILEPFL